MNRLLFLYFLILTACVDAVDFEYKEELEFLVVDGRFSLENRPQQLKLYYANNRYSNRQKMVSNAENSDVN